MSNRLYVVRLEFWANRDRMTFMPIVITFPSTADGLLSKPGRSTRASYSEVSTPNCPLSLGYFYQDHERNPGICYRCGYDMNLGFAFWVISDFTQMYIGRPDSVLQVTDTFLGQVLVLPPYRKNGGR